MNTEQARARAEAIFKRKEEQRSEALKAREEYEARQHAISENTARLRALRLAREQRKETVASRGKSKVRTTNHANLTQSG